VRGLSKGFGSREIDEETRLNDDPGSFPAASAFSGNIFEDYAINVKRAHEYIQNVTDDRKGKRSKNVDVLTRRGAS
jgi:hypothetical protein